MKKKVERQRAEVRAAHWGRGEANQILASLIFTLHESKFVGNKKVFNDDISWDIT